MELTANVRRRHDGSIDFDFYRFEAARGRRAAQGLFLGQAVGVTRRAVRDGLRLLTQPVAVLRRTHPAFRAVMGAIIAALLVVNVGSQVPAQQASGHHHGPGEHITSGPDDLKWSAPAAYANGALLAVIKGDPAKEGMYVVRLRVPAGFVIAAHTHPNDENVTVLSGSFNIGTGDKLDRSKGTLLKAGGYSYVARGMIHHAWFTEDTVLQLHGMGPQGITYTNPADDPRKK